ncbi:Ig-like domain-containing protein, partial [Phaeodactylibacter luteus]
MPDAAFVVTSVAAGSWADNSRIYAPVSAPGSDFHGLGSLGAPVDFSTGGEVLILHFTLPGGGCIDGLRLYSNGIDPGSSDPGMGGSDFTNTIFGASHGMASERYTGNYGAQMTSCTAPNLFWAVDDSFVLTQGATAPLNILDNDNFGLNELESVAVIAPPAASAGTILIDPNGTIDDLYDDVLLFTPAADFIGTVQLSYEICDTEGNCDQADVAIEVLEVQDCQAPGLLNPAYGCDGAVTISWLPALDATSYTLEVEDAMGNPVVDFVNMASTSVTITPGTLTPGEDYTFAVTGSCGTSNVSSFQGAIDGSRIQNRLPELVITDVVHPVCADVDTSGAFTVTVNDNCGAIYDITANGVTVTANTGDPVTFSGLTAAAMPQGSNYEVTVALHAGGGCVYSAVCISELQGMVTLIPEDATAPFISVTGDGGQTINP